MRALVPILFEFSIESSVSYTTFLFHAIPSVPLHSLHILVDPDEQFGFYIQVFIYIQFWYQFFRNSNLVLIFKFLWVSVGTSCSTLPVNAKEYSDIVHFRKKLQFIWCSSNSFMDPWVICFSGSECTCLVFLLTLMFFLVFMYQTDRHMQGNWE